MAGDGDTGAVRQTQQDLEARETVLLRQMQNSDHPSPVTLHPNIAELYRRKAGELQSLLENEESRPQAEVNGWTSRRTFPSSSPVTREPVISPID